MQTTERRLSSSASVSSVRRRTGSISPKKVSLVVKPVAVYCWGWGGNGQLGTNDRESRITPYLVHALLEKTSISKVACGSRFTLALTASGSVFAWGKNDYGQLGIGHHLQAQLEPRLIDSLSDIAITTIATRGSHVLAISEDGAVFSWGRGDEGQLGHNSRETLHLPKRIAKLHHIVDVACGRAHSAALGHNGSTRNTCTIIVILPLGAVYTWGSGEDGALGLDDVESALIPTALLLPSSVQAIACGSRHTLAITSEFTVLSWGWNMYGQLGLGHLDTVRIPTEIPSFLGHKVVQIVCGFRHNFAVVPHSGMTVDVFGWGWNEHGQLGDIELGLDLAVVHRPQRLRSLMDVSLTSLAAGGRHSLCSVHPHGSFAWGRGTDGEVGTGVITSSQRTLTCILHHRVVFQVACGWAHSVGLVQEDVCASTLSTSVTSFKWMTSGDWDAFSGMFVQTILQLMIVSSLLPTQVHLPLKDLHETILPAAVATTVVGNLFFALQGVRLSRHDRRHDVTALPHGINTVLVFAYALSIMEPEFQRTQSFTAAYEVGIFAAIATGVLQMLLLPLLSLLQAAIPKAALLASVSGIALTFLSMGFAFEIWENPLVALGPLLLFLVSYGAGVKLPLHVPTGLGALLLGTSLALGLYYTGTPTTFVPFSEPYAFTVQMVNVDVGLVYRALTSGAGWKYMSIIVPMVLVNVMGAIANLETAAAVGDKYDPLACVFGDSIVTILGACLGNPFPTGIYIGHVLLLSMNSSTKLTLLRTTTYYLYSPSTKPWALAWGTWSLTPCAFRSSPLSTRCHGCLGQFPLHREWASSSGLGW
ncbi:hypothetical protein, variant 2 [Aphanomyces astaci]|uniref:RCC1-like domain-containing protein n=1 Tax=Aphanomyces astaci TaxID=112090 RepID=W4FEP5_APHAT|nr:hypothetical protein, variant 2 [Aphanomyces astaci]ETV65188.1 hypothetical protein, variant 2 [Aphanomyces astaci]|eukprot:XP_009845312.1 hypothetical protein, variant 2 [Aphanomyces astaci]